MHLTNTSDAVPPQRATFRTTRPTTLETWTKRKTFHNRSVTVAELHSWIHTHSGQLVRSIFLMNNHTAGATHRPAVVIAMPTRQATERARSLDSAQASFVKRLPPKIYYGGVATPTDMNNWLSAKLGRATNKRWSNAPELPDPRPLAAFSREWGTVSSLKSRLPVYPKISCDP